MRKLLLIFAILSICLVWTKTSMAQVTPPVGASDKISKGKSSVQVNSDGSVTTTTNSTQRVTVKNDGNVGIGTSAPAYKLDVNGAVRASSFVGSFSPTGNLDMLNNLILNIGNSGTDFTSSGGLTLAGLLSATTANFSGNVGIGKTNPATALDVNGNITCNTLNYTTLNPAVSVGSGTTNYMAKWLTSTTLQNGQIYDNGTNIGIGTTAPSAKINVALSASSDQIKITQSNATAGAGPLIDIVDTRTAYDDWDKSTIRLTGADYGDQVFTIKKGKAKFFGETSFANRTVFAAGAVVQSYDDIWNYFGGGYNYRLGYNSASGNLELADFASTNKTLFINTLNVGIGTSAPTEKLDINGSMNLSGDITLTGDVDGKDVSLLPDGSGTTNYITKWTASGTIGNSTIYDNGANVGIGTTSPSAPLDIAGIVKADTINEHTLNSGVTVEGVLLKDSAFQLGANSDANHNKIINLASPIDGGDAANKDYVDLLIGGITWQPPVKQFLNLVTSEPVSPTLGDRYIATATGSSSHTHQSVTVDDIYQWNGVSWTQTVPSNGYELQDLSTSYNWVYTASGWIKLQSVTLHNDLSTIQGGSSTERYHVSQAIYNALTDANAQLAQLTTLGYPTFANMYVSGNVGIGTTAPAYKMDVNGALKSSTILDNGSTVGIGTTSFDVTNPEKLKVDAGITSSKNIISGYGTCNNYLQLNIKNASSGNKASSDLVATADNGDESNYYIDTGINGSGYNQPAFDIVGANDGYLYVAGKSGNPGGNLAIGTATSGTTLKLHVGGTTAASEKMRIDSTGNVGVGTTSPTAALDVNGQIRLRTGASNGYILQSNADGVGSWVAHASYIGGSGTTNYVPKFSSASTIGNSAIYDNGNVGIGTTAPPAKLTVTDGSFLVDGTTGTTPASGAGTRMMWIPSKHAFRAGRASSTQWDNGNIGDGSVALGDDVTASGMYAMAMGYNISAADNYTITLGTNASTSNTYATAIGRNVTSSGHESLAMGGFTTAGPADYAIAMGRGVTANGDYAIALGQGVNTSTPMVNSAPSSLGVGFNSTIPTLFVGPSNGAGTTGNVGIGTTAPATALSVNGVITASGGNSTLWNSALQSEVDGVIGNEYPTAGNDTDISNNTQVDIEPELNYVTKIAPTGNLEISPTANVGVGMSAPVYKLDVSGTARVSTSLNTPKLSNLTTNGFVKTSGSDGTLSVDTSTYLTTIGSLTNNYLPKSNGTNLSNSQVFDTGTNVGIGTTTPGFTLDIYKAAGSNTDVSLGDGDVGHGVTTLAPTTTWLLMNEHTADKGGAQLTGFSDASDNPAMEIKGINSTDPDTGIPAIVLDGYSANGTGVKALAATKTVAEIQNNGSALVTVLGNGNLGVGTAVPSRKLEIVGRAKVLTSSGENVLISGGNEVMTGTSNTVVGKDALLNNSTGFNNVALGYEALRTNTTGNYNVAAGYKALYTNNGSQNIAIGYESQKLTDGGSRNVSIGQASLPKNTSGNDNTAIGDFSMIESLTGNANTAVGQYSLFNITSGSNNVAIGGLAGYNANAESSGNVFLGKSAGPTTPARAVNNSLYINNSASDTPLIFGNFSTGNVGIGSSAPSRKLEVNGGLKTATILDNSTNVGIGTTSPLTKLTVVDTASASPRGILSMQYSTDTNGARVGLAKARGTAASPTTVVSGDMLGRMMFRGYDGSNFLEMGSIDVFASGTVASTRVPTTMAFYTATDAAPSVLTERMRLDSMGNIGIGTSTPTAKLEAVSPATDITGINLRGGGNNYLQINCKNTTGGDAASSDFVATANTGSESDGYIDVGINSSTYNQAAYNIGGALDSYVYSVGVGTTGGNLAIGTATSGKAIKFHTGGTTTAQERMRIDGSGNIGIGITAPTTKLDISGDVKVTGTGNPSYFLTNVGIGVVTPAVALDVNGDLKVLGSAGPNYFLNNVGIGTSAPTVALEVSGTTKSTAFAVGNVGISASGTTCSCTRYEGGICTAGSCS